ncbi:threonylcarbamoyladenosine tRNA methylthiotransferase MtaB [Methylomagnum ishizawai]|uniref:Threonylcarbamoyladenosine tRNA methylthiotransferase MtaB n=1 Tax=Methylomagnum ishizawai TaxID=1760988 RepID=A0A1Y6D2Y6_9GAMM|nr:tRNA (N(6)-L-threonylcarbamoyladenosine(37)-C(2))-methylthiotransferase MtaB [Methylomagnum ishizawai]SMF94922.1 threonylcarbamoyladenosine tRNA methylthiotransferase MtaB [Methylomagnum ishizawai]
MRIHFKTLGCRLNEAELETWARQFQAEGHRVVDEAETADLVVFNSCAVTQDAVRKSRHLLRKTARENPAAKLVLSGCYATLNHEEAEGLGVDLVIANADKHRLVEIARDRLDLPTRPALATEPGETALFRLGRHRAFVKVQDGCRHRCTYCIVTVARGEERSRPIAEIVEEIDALHRQGIQETVLTGVHLGGYGGEIGTDLAGLVAAVLEQTAIPRLRLGSLEPWDIPAGFVELFQNPRLMPHLHLPLQSGSDTVLKRMARRCRTGDFAALVAGLRAAVPDINITTDLIVGFPGESAAEWAETLEFVERTGFGAIHIFGFSPRTGTAAASMPNPVHGEVKQARGRALHALAERQRRETLAQYVGREFPVLWEGVRREDDGRGVIYGYTPNYLRVGMAVSGECDLSYRVTTVRVMGLADGGDCLWA